ncbi:MAG: phage head morphogenesis protein [Clostridium butyricum]|nr:phage head morphogenesis protein [Clostridium butyricum]
MKKNREYWSKRSEQLEEALLNKGENFANDLDNQYKIANARLQKEIDAWYQRFAKNNCISLTEAKRLLNTNELKEFRWTVQDYIKYGQKNAVNPYWMEELENASCKVHISRLESLKLQLQQQVEVLYGNQLDGLDRTMRDIYSEGYYHTAFEIQKGFNTGYSFMKFNENELEKVISKPWALDGENFSSRVWKNKSKLINTLHTNLTQALIRGDNPEKIVGNIASTMETSRKAARRLVMTESAYFSAASQKDCYSDLGIKEYEIVATLDSHTSETCQELDRKVFKMSDYEVGVTAPPFHCWCRTCTCPYFNDEFTIGEKRAARSLNDKTEYIPSDIKYPEWKKRYVKESSKLDEGDLLDKVKSLFQNSTKSKVNEFKNKLENIQNEDVKKLLSQSEERVNFAKSTKKSSYFNKDEKTIYLKDNADLSTVAHELFHEIDNTYQISKSGMVINQIESDYNRLKNIALGYGKEIDEMLYSKYPNIFYTNDFDEIIVYKEYRGISDIIHGMTNGKVDLGYGHRQKGYWNKTNALSKETWAQYGRMLYENNEDVLKILQELFPETTNEINRILREMIK